MVLLENDAFLNELTKLFQKSRTTGSVYLTMKKYHGQVKPKPKASKSDGSHDHQEHKCLVRATNGKKKITTVISSKDVNKFQMAYATVLKANVDSLKKRDKSSKGKGNKSKATQ
ncbi:signal recognition particle 14 kDa protein-like [Saccoglossus kowalevskii]|uniref:Signal recognition particle 14 kDa protein n=1 Tax=Saccoglossus kowalevskii TaxID=10224 RepID=A0ABM0GX10_SACKO|nr:PREDICTED: signal recognition particle 14 kDa protein-like [Saccoglossus kowalevskii]